MRVRVAHIAAIALLGMMAVPSVGWAEPGVEVVRAVSTHPTVSMSAGAGTALAPGALVRVSVSGLPTDLAAVACVTLAARPRGASGDGMPLFACTGGGCVHLLGLSACGAAGSYDRRTGSGSMDIPWNANQHLQGLYEIRAEVLLSYPDNRWGLWRRTDWVVVNLRGSSTQVVDVPPPCRVSLESPLDGALFTRGERVPLVGHVIAGRGLQGISAQVTRVTGLGEAPLSTWVTGQGRLYPDGRFETVWDTEGLTAGLYRVRVICTTTDGVSTPSQAVTVTVSDRPDCQYVITANSVPIKDGDRIEVETGEQIQFCLSAESVAPLCHIGSLRWVFGPGRESTEKCPRYAYTEEGQYAVRLTLFGSPGLQGDVLLTRTFSVVVRPRRPVAVGTREVLGFPDPCAGTMTVLPGIPIYARVVVTTSAPVASLAIREVLPHGWSVSDETSQPEDEGAPYTIQRMHRMSEVTGVSTAGELRHVYTWLILPRVDIIPAGTSLEILYRLTPPVDPSLVTASSGQAAVQPLQGMLRVRTAAEGDRDYPMYGEARLSIADRLSIPVSVAHLADGGIEARRFGPEGESPTYLITAEQLAQALRLLDTGEEVPFTGRMLNPDDAMDIAFYFTQRIPVTECIR